MTKSNMRLGYIARSVTNGVQKFLFREASYTRKITSRGDKIYSKMLAFPVDYEDVEETTRQIKEDGVMVVTEPFFLDDGLEEKVLNWIEWTNSVERSMYDPFAE